MKHLFRRFWNDCSGATAMEYGLIAVGLAGAIIATVNVLGIQLDGNFQSAMAALAGKKLETIGIAER